MERRVLLVAGLMLGLLGMHALAPGHPVTETAHAAMPAATASGSYSTADGHAPAKPHHHDLTLHHDLCKAVLAAGPAPIGPATAPALPSSTQSIDLPSPRSSRCGPGDGRPPDIFRLGVLRI